MKCGLDATLSVPRNSSPNDKSGRGSASVRSGVPHGEREVYLEFLVVGDSIKVVAVDAASGTEVSITGSVHAPKAELEKVAMDKLRYVMAERCMLVEYSIIKDEIDDGNSDTLTYILEGGLWSLENVVKK